MALHRDLPTILRVDALQAPAGLGVLLAAPALAAPLGLSTPWPLRAVAGLVILNGVANWIAARATPSPSRAAVGALVVIDLAFAAAVLALAVADPTGAQTWMRWVLALVADISATFGALKLAALRRTGARAAVRPA